MNLHEITELKPGSLIFGLEVSTKTGAVCISNEWKISSNREWNHIGVYMENQILWRKLPHTVVNNAKMVYPGAGGGFRTIAFKTGDVVGMYLGYVARIGTRTFVNILTSNLEDAWIG